MPSLSIADHGPHSREPLFLFDLYGGHNEAPTAEDLELQPGPQSRQGPGELPAATTSPHAAPGPLVSSPTPAPVYDSDDELLRSLESDCLPGLEEARLSLCVGAAPAAGASQALDAPADQPFKLSAKPDETADSDSDAAFNWWDV